MLYNDSISYNQPGVNFLGSVTISVPGLGLPIFIGEINIFFSEEIDYSNNTNLGVVTVSYGSSGAISVEKSYQTTNAVVSYSIADSESTAQLSIETDYDTATAIANASQINIISYSEISIDY
jgi:hypothetical protein